MGKCLDDLRANYNRGLTEAEITEIFNEAQALWKGAQASQHASSQNALAQRLAGQMAEREKIAAVIKKRNAYLQLARKAAIAEDLLGNWQGREGEGLMAVLSGSKYARKGARMSVDGLRTGIKGEYLGGLLTDVKELGGAHFVIFRKGTMDREIARALWTIDNPAAQAYAGPPEAMEIARVIHKWQEKARIDQNRAGGFIGKTAGYIARQSHDMDKIGAAGYQKWHDYIVDRLDWRRTADGRYDPALNPSAAAEREEFLEAVYHNLSSGIHLKESGAPANPLALGKEVGSLAARVSNERVLHFVNADAWFDYNALYGSGNLREAVMRGLERAANNGALMQTLGPSPHANLENIIRIVESSLNRRGDLRAVRSFKNKLKSIHNVMAELDGTVNIPAHATRAKVMRVLRALESMANLGGALISSLPDIPNFAYEMAYQGKGFARSLVRGFGLMIQGRGSLEQQRILSSCGVFYDSLCGEIIAKFSGSEIPGKMSAMMNLYFRMNGLSWWTDAWKKAAALMMSHDMALMRGKAFGELSGAERRLFELYGIDEGQWDMLRAGAAKMADGREYLTPDAAFDASEPAIAEYLQKSGVNVTPLRVENFRAEMADRLRTLFRDRVQYAVLEPDARTNAILRQGTQAGTVSGELLRCVTQFKSFPTVFMQRALSREIYGRGYDGGASFWGNIGGAAREIGKGALGTLFLRNMHGEMSNFAGLLVMMTLFGYASMTAKQLLAGKTPRPADDPKTWLAAAAQGGGLGIYGDFLFGEKSRMGGSFASTFGGPLYSAIEDLTNLYYSARNGEDVGANAFRVFYNNMPGNNLFWIRSALDYTIANNFMEFLNPGYLNRMRKRIERENGQTFWHEPAMKW